MSSSALRLPTLSINIDSLGRTLISLFTGSRSNARDSVADLLDKASIYEASQPSFAADLRAAAASMSRTQA